jgi:hypothetical protein
MDNIVQIVGNMFKNVVYLHCDKCDHEQAECLGNKCAWCGGNMLPMH